MSVTAWTIPLKNTRMCHRLRQNNGLERTVVLEIVKSFFNQTGGKNTQNSFHRSSIVQCLVVSLLKPTTARAEPRQTKIMVHWLYSGGDQASKRGYNGQRGGCRLDEDLMFFALGKKRKHRVHIHDSIGKTVSVHVKLFKCPRVHRTATRDKNEMET